MKLRDVVLMGRFCGLETVEECVCNYEMHYVQCISYKDIAKENTELNSDLQDYYSGDLILDWPKIEKEVEAQLKEYDEQCRANVYIAPVQEFDLR